MLESRISHERFGGFLKPFSFSFSSSSSSSSSLSTSSLVLLLVLLLVPELLPVLVLVLVSPLVPPLANQKKDEGGEGCVEGDSPGRCADRYDRDHLRSLIGKEQIVASLLLSDCGVGVVAYEDCDCYCCCCCCCCCCCGAVCIVCCCYAGYCCCVGDCRSDLFRAYVCLTPSSCYDAVVGDAAAVVAVDVAAVVAAAAYRHGD